MPIDTTILKLLVPVILLQVGLMIFALIDLSKRKQVKGNNKLLWGIIIVLFQILGPLVYFIIGRED